MNKRKLITVITDILGDRVLVYHDELMHSINKHFQNIPLDMVLDLFERILKDPSSVYRDDGAYFSSAYPTGNQPRNSHKKLKRVEL